MGSLFKAIYYKPREPTKVPHHPLPKKKIKGQCWLEWMTAACPIWNFLIDNKTGSWGGRCLQQRVGSIGYQLHKYPCEQLYSDELYKYPHKKERRWSYLQSRTTRRIAGASDSSLPPSPSHSSTCSLVAEPPSSPFSLMANQRTLSRTGEPGQHL